MNPEDVTRYLKFRVKTDSDLLKNTLSTSASYIARNLASNFEKGNFYKHNVLLFEHLNNNEIGSVFKAVQANRERKDKGVLASTYLIGSNEFGLCQEVSSCDTKILSGALVTSICAEQNGLDQMKRIKPESVPSIVIATQGQDDPMQCCPRCRHMLLKYFGDHNPEIIYVSHDQQGKILKMGKNMLHDLAPSQFQWTLDDEQMLVKKVHFNETINQVLSDDFQENLPKALTEKKQNGNVAYATIVFKDRHSNFIDNFAGYIRKSVGLPSGQPKNLVKVKVNGEKYSTLTLATENVKGTSSNWSPAKTLLEVMYINYGVPQIFGIFSHKDQELLYLDYQATAWIESICTQLKNKPDLLIGIPGQEGKVNIVEAQNFYPNPSVTPIYDSTKIQS
jgi:cytidine deaminase